MTLCSGCAPLRVPEWPGSCEAPSRCMEYARENDLMLCSRMLEMAKQIKDLSPCLRLELQFSRPILALNTLSVLLDQVTIFQSAAGASAQFDTWRVHLHAPQWI